MHRARETIEENPSLSSEVQSLKEKLDEHSKQLEQSVEKLSQLHSENTILRDQNQALNATGNKKHRFNARGPKVKDTRNWRSFQRSRTLDHSINPRNPRRTYVDRSAWSPPKPFKVASARKTWSSHDPRPPPHIDKIAKPYQVSASGLTDKQMRHEYSKETSSENTSDGLEQRAPRRNRLEKLSQTHKRSRALQKKEEPSNKEARPKSKSKPAEHLATTGPCPQVRVPAAGSRFHVPESGTFLRLPGQVISPALR
uniref:Uncharacterized protein n=1 Tax=Brassica campestris TaxID=3711 RepID=M4FIB8_BRACM